jgi:hypothetical protein
MIATLEFDLNDHDDKSAHNKCIKAQDMWIALWQIQVKLQHEMMDRSDDRIVAEIFDKINNIISNNGINLDEL